MFLSVLLLCGILTLVQSQTDLPLQTKKGPIIGSHITSTPATNVGYDAFIGIPYAQKPDRFKVAIERAPWTKAITTQADGAMCPQPNVPESSYSEECLFLNVYTPTGASAASATKTYPVIAYIHGSAFTFSSSSSKILGPDFLVPKNVILVTMNYRLGSTGFLTLGSQEAPGNLGLTDTLLALKWIQDEISAFGGDPKLVTLMGQSAGSIMTHFHYISRQSTELFVRAIGHSGSALAQWGHVTLEEGARRGKMLAKAVGCDTTKNNTMILACLQQADIKDILVNQSLTLSTDLLVSGSGLPFVPVLDNYQSATMPFFNDTLENLMKEAVARGKPLITGFTTDEGILRSFDNGWPIAEANLAAFTPESASGGKRDSYASAIRDRYFPQTVDENKVADLVRIFTDFMFAYPAIQVAKYYSNVTYGYLFAYNGAWVRPSAFFAKYHLSGVSHGDDLSYLFYDSSRTTQSEDTCSVNKPNMDMRDNMVKWWISFVTTGVPDQTWQTVSNNGYRVIDSTITTLNNSAFEDKYYTFWANMYSSASSVKLSVFAVVIALLTIASFYL